MTKLIKIDGMSCEHCMTHVTNALAGLPGVSAVVDLAAGTATVTADHDIDDGTLKTAVEEAGYDVTSITGA